MRLLRLLLGLAVLSALIGASSRAPISRMPRAAGTSRAETCRQGTPVDPGAVLDRALNVMGVTAADGRVLHFKATAATLARNQSDRWYPPYLRAFNPREYWIDAETGVERVASDLVWPIGGAPHTTVLQAGDTTWVVRDTLFAKSATAHPAARMLDPWAVVRDWRHDPSARYAEECSYRDYWRTVLERGTGDDVQRLYLDPKSGYPVKLDYEEAHYLWGQEHVEWVWSTWVSVEGGGASYPGAAFRMEDGETVQSQTLDGVAAFLDRDKAPSVAPPDPTRVMGGGAAPRPSPLNEPPSTVRVSDSTFLLVNRVYTETVTLQGDTVYVLDATSGETRARADSAWIAQLFPGNHPVTVVVTDVAWPHIAGVRFWVARGARVVAHAASVPFLRQVTARRWTRTPDALERSSEPRGTDLRVTAVTDSVSLAGGRIRLYPIDGVASEGALMAWVPGDGYLWASDFVQTVDEPSEYASEVAAAARRVGIVPRRLAAEHLPLTPWEAVLQVTGH